LIPSYRKLSHLSRSFAPFQILNHLRYSCLPSETW